MIPILIGAGVALLSFVLLLPFLYTVSIVGIITCVIIILTTLLDLRPFSRPSRNRASRRIVTVHSLDGIPWFSSRTDARQCKKQREKFWRESKRSIKRSAIFAHENRHARRMPKMEARRNRTEDLTAT